MTDALLEPSPDRSEDRAYRWAVRSLYLVALGLNAYLIWDMVKDDTEVQVQLERVKAWWKAKTESCEPCRRRKEKLMANHVVWEAIQVVTRRKGDETDGD